MGHCPSHYGGLDWVTRVVLLSGRGEHEAEAAERLVQDTPLPWTILRCSWFAQNFSENFLLDPNIGHLTLEPGTSGPAKTDSGHSR